MGHVGKEWKMGEKDCKHAQVTCSWGVKTHRYYTSCCLALSVGQMEHLCLGYTGFWLRGTLSNLLVISALLWKKQSPGINHTCVDAWNTGENSKFAGFPAWIKLHGACILPYEPLPKCCFRDPLFDKVMKINVFFAFIHGSVLPAPYPCQVTQDTKKHILSLI